METIIVGARGQVTLPKKIREQLGIKPKSPVIIEARNGGAFIRPVAVTPLRTFSDEYIAEITDRDNLNESENTEILKKWKK